MQDSFNLVHAAHALQRKGRSIIVLTLLAGMVATVTVFLVPQYFKSTATIVSANPVLADKARLFNENIQGLYSYFGNGDDLDRIEGMADIDTTYKKLVDEFSLADYYNIDTGNKDLARRNAVLKLRRDIEFERTTQGQLRIVAWTKEASLSARIVNRMVALVTEMETRIWQSNYEQTVQQLDRNVSEMEIKFQSLGDSMPFMTNNKRELAATRRQLLLQQIQQYQAAADEFKLAAATHPPVLYTLEQAVPAAKAEIPNKVAIILAALALGFIFSCLAALFISRPRAA